MAVRNFSKNGLSQITFTAFVMPKAVKMRWVVSNDHSKFLLKFIYSEKATKLCEISTLPLSYVVPVKSKVKILQNFVAFSEYMNFNVRNTKRLPTI